MISPIRGIYKTSEQTQQKRNSVIYTQNEQVVVSRNWCGEGREVGEED